MQQHAGDPATAVGLHHTNSSAFASPFLAQFMAPVLISPFAALKPEFLFAPAAAAAAANPGAAGAQQQHAAAAMTFAAHHPAGAAVNTQTPAAAAADGQEEEEEDNVLLRQRSVMWQAQCSLLQRQARIVQEELLRRQQHRQQVAEAAGPLDFSLGGLQAPTPAAGLMAAAGAVAGAASAGGALNPVTASNNQLKRQRQRQQSQQQAQQVHTAKAGKAKAGPAAGGDAGAAGTSAAAAAAAPVKRRGRPPKADGQYSEAYLALKRYRARRKNEVQEMEAELEARKAKLLELQRENTALKNKHDALETTLEAQSNIVQELAALQLREQQQQQQQGKLLVASSTAAAAAPSAAAAGGVGSSGRNSGGRAAGALQGAACNLTRRPDDFASGSASAVEALVAALTGQPQQHQHPQQQQNQQNQGVLDAHRLEAAAAAAAAATATAAAGLPAGGGGGAFDWAGNARTHGCGVSSTASAQAGKADQQQLQQQQQGEDCTDVQELLDRYKAYVAAAAAALAHLAAALPPTQQQQQEEEGGQQVPLGAVGCFTSEQVSALGLVLPPWPITLAEYLVLGNAERIPPSMPACNLLTGQHESIEPEIWRTVASQVQLRPWQVGKLTAAWDLYATALDNITEERASLIQRLKQAMDKQQQMPSAATTTTTTTAAAGGDSGCDPETAAEARNMREFYAALNGDEYRALCEAVDANLSREDNIMILFDYTLGNMLDEVQLALICVASWPYMPLLGCVCKWLIDGVTAAADQE